MLQKYVFPDFCLIYLAGFFWGGGVGIFLLFGGCVCVFYLGFLFVLFMVLLFFLGIYLDLSLLYYGPS